MHQPTSHHHSTWTLEPVARDGQEDDKNMNHAMAVPFLHLRHVFARLFLPLGYPHSVATGYMAYQVYDSIQALSSYLRGVVCTSAVLQASGVGQADANAVSAAMQWATRDGVGMVGGLVFSYQCSDVLDLYVQEFRLLADLSNDVALTLDLMAPLLLSVDSSSTPLLILLSASTIGKTICGIAAGATKGRITQYFAVQGNMADLTAKESTQETFVSLCGMMGGLGMAHLLQSSVGQHQQEEHHVVVLWTTWILFGILTIIHVWANYRAVALLQFPTLNPTRARACILPVLEALKDDNDKSKRDVAALCQQHLLGPNEIPCSIWTTLFRLLTTGNGNPDGILVHDAKRDDGMNFADWMSLASQMQSRCYAIDWSHNKSIRIVLLEGATHRTELQAYIHALWLSCVHQDHRLENASRGEVLKRSFKVIHDDFMDALWQALRDKGWELEPRLYLGFSEQRYRMVEVNGRSSKKEN